jgi:hypothetical protein
MIKKNLLTSMMVVIFFLSVPFLNAQQKQTGDQTNKSTGMGMGSGMQNAMDQIASDSTMRLQMVTKMLDKVKNDSTGMMRIFSKIMENPQAHKMMMKYMEKGVGSVEGMGGRMMKNDKTMKDMMPGKDTISRTPKP